MVKTSTQQLYVNLISRGQFAPKTGGQFRPISRGQFRAKLGGQFQRFFHLTTFLFSCEDEKEETTKSKTELITSASWKVSGYSTSATDTFSLSVLKSWNDDLKTTPINVTYNTNGTYLYSDSSDYGTWELSGDNSVLFDKGTSKQTTATINNISTNNFVITYPWSMSSSLIVNVTETAVR